MRRIIANIVKEDNIVRLYLKNGSESIEYISYDIEDEDLIKLFKKNGFNAVKYDGDYDITIWFEKEVENLSAEDCFDL